MNTADQKTKNSDLKDRLYLFALNVISMVKTMPKKFVSIELGRQLLRAGTSVAANYEEAAAGFSKPDFIFKMSIAFKEAKEARLWLRLIYDSGILADRSVKTLIVEADEISRILAASLKTARSKS